MGQYDTGDLYRRQHTDDVGHAVLGSSARSSNSAGGRSGSRWRCSSSGILLGMWGPLPGWGWS